MRPILLELNGFASYRGATTVDFRDTDFFVLVGPTGSGKSTVIDAMVFALYGTVPRWDDRSAVAPALAPTVNRAVVRLIFDLGGKRYAATRDVRRSGGKNPTVSIREGRLEQFVSRDAVGAPDDEIITLATGRSVNSAVEQLLGLDFGQFTQSVALPQGEFARFLHATDGERQAILKNLLGYTVYDRIQRAAYARCAEANTKADTLVEQLGSYADATEESVSAAATALTRLSALLEHVKTEAVPALKSAFDTANTARAAIDTATAELKQLVTVVKPDDVDELDAQKRSAAAALVDAENSQRKLEDQDLHIRIQLRALTPRHDLEQVLAHWQELSDLQELLPSLTETVARAKSAHLNSGTVCETAEAAVSAAQAAADEALAVSEEFRRQMQTAREHLGLLEDLQAPSDVTAIADAVASATEQLSTMTTALVECESRQQALADELDRLPDAGILSLAEGAAEKLLAVIAQDTEQAAQRNALQEAAESARRDVEAAAEALTVAEQRLRAAEHANQALALRADLHAGDDCPVCGQYIAELPFSAATLDLDAALYTFNDAKAVAQNTAREADRLGNEQLKAQAIREERLNQCETARVELGRRLADLGVQETWQALNDQVHPDRLAALSEDSTTAQRLVTQAIETRTATEALRRETDTAVTAARKAVESAQSTLEAARQQSRHAQIALHAARDTVSALNPPQLTDADTGAAWEQLIAWADAQKLSIQEQVELLTPQAAEARTAVQRAQQELGTAESQAQVARTAYTETAVAAEKAVTELGLTQERENKLIGLLSTAPAAETVATELANVKALEERRADLDLELEQARTVTARAGELVDAANAAVTGSWEQLRRIRDSLACFGVPELTGAELVPNWERILTWAGDAAEARRSTIDEAQSKLSAAEALALTAAAGLADEIAKNAVELAPDLSPTELAEQAPVAVAAAEATAKGALEHARERLRQSERMRAKVKSLRESADVAHMLSNLMRANQFPRWLIASALDALLQDASQILLELSGGQFELTRDERDLLVIDHNDADMPRPVKTLSGGETFQASLALALALSSQVTALSAVGASKLESIFLDEGFGTLDEATLDVVAGTLETLAASGSRMVGVITHVAALAERIPVRYQVSRDSAGSHIERLQV
jgi:exonuclease SbcC